MAKNEGYDLKVPIREDYLWDSDSEDLVSGSRAVKRSKWKDVLGQVDPRRFYQIDGDLNHWQAGDPGTLTPTSGSKTYMSDMASIEQTAGNCSYARTSSELDTKDYAIEVNTLLTGESFFNISCLKGDVLKNKIVSIFILAKTNGTAIANVNPYIRGDGWYKKSSSSFAVSNTLTWYRIDIDQSETSVTTQDFTNFGLCFQGSAAGQSFVLEKFILIETGDLPAGVTPDWIKEDEDPQKTIDEVLLYFEKGYVDIRHTIDITKGFIYFKEKIKAPAYSFKNLIWTRGITGQGSTMRFYNNSSLGGPGVEIAEYGVDTEGSIITTADSNKKSIYIFTQLNGTDTDIEVHGEIYANARYE